MGELTEQSVPQPVEETPFWDSRVAAWDANADRMEPFAGQFGDPAIDRLDPRPGQNLADIGCGPGLTTLQLAHRVGPDGSVTGIDISRGMVASATRRATTRQVANARFKVADAGSDAIGTFDGVYSRFGVMFFEHPNTAFGNLARSIRPGGRFVAVVWAELAANPWMFTPVMHAAGPLDAEVRPPDPDQPGPFSLGDPHYVTDLLLGSGFGDVDVTRHEGALTFDEATSAQSIGAVLAMGALGEPWASADEQARSAAIDAVKAGCDEYREGGTWRIPATALIASATHPE